jgi:hypothetical protein
MLNPIFQWAPWLNLPVLGFAQVATLEGLGADDGKMQRIFSSNMGTYGNPAVQL